MQNFIKFILYKTQSIDGSINSAQYIIKAGEVESRKMKLKLKQKEKNAADLRHKLMIKANFRYNMLRIRSKISFMAFKKHMTISELFFTTILKVYDH